MLKVIKLNAPDNEIAFVSDLHYGHDKPHIWQKRGYASGREHDDGLIHQWNSVCTDRSQVFHLGDICFVDPDGVKFKNLMRRLQFNTLWTHLGNHNSGHKLVYAEALREQFPQCFEGNDMVNEVYPLSWQVDGDPNKTVIFLPEYSEATINGRRVIMCHFPIISHNKVGHGSWMICGHSHSSCALTNKDTGVGKRLDLGIESFGRPITFAELRRFMDARPVHSYDHHDHTTT